MKILMLTGSYAPIIGGTETVIRNLTIHLNKNGIHTDIMTINMDELWSPKWNWEIKNEEGFKVFRVPAFNPFNFKKIPNLTGIFFKAPVFPDPNIGEIIEEYDILHFHGEGDMTLFLLSYFIKKPKIFHYHSLQSLKETDWGFHIYKVNLLYRYMLKNGIDCHICNSRPALELLIKLGIREDKIKIIPNSVDLNRFSIKNDKQLYSYSQNLNINYYDKTKKIAYIGRLIPSKLDSVISTIEAMPKIIWKVPNVQLIIIGNGACYNYIREISERMNKQLNNPKSVIMTGAIPMADMPMIINLADLVIGIGQIPIEAMASGKPAIVAGQVKGPFGGNFGGIVTKENVDKLKEYNFSGRNSSEVTNPDRIADAVIKLLTDKQYKQSIGEFGMRFVENELDMNKTIKKLINIYNTLL